MPNGNDNGHCKLMIYDWNGTLVNDSHIVYEGMCEIFRKLAPGKPIPSFDVFRCEINHSDMADFYHRHGVPRDITVEMMIAVQVPRYRYVARCWGLQLNAGAKLLLAACMKRSIKNAIVSASADDVVKYLTRFNAYDLFDSIALKMTNKQATLEKTVASCRSTPDRSYYIDDTFDGLMHAKQAGIKTIGFARGLHTPERIGDAKPDHVVHHLHEVIDLLAIA